MTSADGLTTTDVSLDEFCARPHAEAEVTMSADWILGEVMDGYVVCTCRHDGRTAIEWYQYGTLDRLEPKLLDVLFLRFAALVRSFGHGMLAVDASGASSADDWRDVYSGGAEIPQTATVLAMPIGVFHNASHLTRVYGRDGIEVFAATKRAQIKE
jgi:hypothetical protein